jgi:anti-sigma regulatory factor (Ser/Thr protein kinase)
MQPLIVPGKPDSLEKIRKYTLLAAQDAGLDNKRAYKLSLAVDEIATNIITYGYQREGVEGEILVEANLDERALTITLDDTSGYYDPTLKPSVSPEDFDRPLEDRGVGGWGVYLAIHSVDEYVYKRRQDHNLNVFVVYRTNDGE